MYVKNLLYTTLFALPSVAAAQSVQSFGSDLIGFINTVLLPFLFAIALVIFVYYMVRYFIIDVENYDYKERARNYAIYALIAFVLMTSIWGVVNMVVNGLGFGREQAVCPDTVPDGYCEEGFGGSSQRSSSGSNSGNWDALQKNESSKNNSKKGFLQKI